MTCSTTKVADIRELIYISANQILFKWKRRFPHQVKPDGSRKKRNDYDAGCSPTASDKVYSLARKKFAEDERPLIETITEIVYIPGPFWPCHP